MIEEQTVFDGFVDDSPPEPQVIDRSTLERWATCPHRAILIDRRAVSTGNELTDVGDEVHRILSAAVHHRKNNGARPAELREAIEEWAMKSRPDVQPEVMAATRRTWPIVNLLCNHGMGQRAPEDILRYDGGTGEYSGQLAADLMVGDDAMVTLTAELDLLMAGASVEEVELTDWKSGWRWWTATDVRDSFQFQFYAWLIFMNYPAVNRVLVRVFMTREGVSTSVVEFDRKGQYAIHQRLLSAARVYLKHHAAAAPEDVPAWPSPSKCATCDAAQHCLMGHTDGRDVAADPEAAIRQLAVYETAYERQKALLSAAVRKRGADFVFAGHDPVAFGVNKPRATRAPACDLYEPAGGKGEPGG